MLPGLRAELEALRRRHSAALELMGERDEEVFFSLLTLKFLWELCFRHHECLVGFHVSQRLAYLFPTRKVEHSCQLLKELPKRIVHFLFFSFFTNESR